MAITEYAIALGSNRRHGRHGAPASVLRAAMDALGRLGTVEKISPIFATPALGPAGRSFANAALILSTDTEPDDLWRKLKDVERMFGRRGGRRWGPRILELDIILWSGGSWESQGLVVPHPAFRERTFVLAPLQAIIPDWRDPVSGRTIMQLAKQLAAPRPVDPSAARP